MNQENVALILPSLSTHALSHPAVFSGDEIDFVRDQLSLLIKGPGLEGTDAAGLARVCWLGLNQVAFPHMENLETSEWSLRPVQFPSVTQKEVLSLHDFPLTSVPFSMPPLNIPDKDIQEILEAFSFLGDAQRLLAASFLVGLIAFAIHVSATSLIAAPSEHSELSWELTLHGGE